MGGAESPLRKAESRAVDLPGSQNLHAWTPTLHFLHNL
jgi:hypothetical protein